MTPHTDKREILIAGAGSVGRRHLANLQALGWSRLRLYRTRQATLPEAALDGLPTATDLHEALTHQPLAVVVSNPTSLHLPVAMAAARAGAHLLIEKPVADDLDGLADLARETQARRLTVLVGFQLRFSPGLRQLKRWLEDGAIGRLVSAQVHFGESLPGMHPWEDFRAGYAGRRDLGGGVLLTLCHPFDYLRWLAGDIVGVRALAGPETLDVPVETCADVALRFAAGATAHVHLNFVQQPREHRLTLVGTGGTLCWSEADHTAHRYDPDARQWHALPAPSGYERNHMFIEEMRHFLACVQGHDQPVCPLEDGIAALRIVLAARRSMVANGTEVAP